jgi:hypothetical protein
MLKLMEHNELNRTTLLSFCGLNLKKHKSILDELESNEFVSKNELSYGKKDSNQERLKNENKNKNERQNNVVTKKE